jgi:hypothetical protein
MQPPQGPNPHYHNTHPTAGPFRVQGASLFLANLNVRTHLANKDDPKREKKRKVISGKVGKEMLDCRDEYVPLRPLFSSPLNFVLEDGTSLRIFLHSTAPQCSSPLVKKLILILTSVYIPFLSSAPPCSGSKKSIAWNFFSIQTAYEEERERVGEEWRKGRDRIRDRPLEGIEARRRHAREEKEKEGEGTVNGTSPSLSPQYFLIFFTTFIRRSVSVPCHPETAKQSRHFSSNTPHTSRRKSF